MDRYELLAAARRELRELERQQDALGLSESRESHGFRGPLPYRRGMAVEACRHAEAALFNALNVLTNHCDDERAQAVLHS